MAWGNEQDKLEDVTFIVKTFERFNCVKRLVKSIYRYYPDAIIRIADDSEKSCKAYLEQKYGNKDLKVYELPSDVGLSYGRNYLMDRVETKYFCLLDDDFVFDKKTDIAAAMKMIQEKDLDILGGFFRNYNAKQGVKARLKSIARTILLRKAPYKPYNYMGELRLDSENRILYGDYITNQFPDYKVVDIVHNFFVARTSVIREKNRWDDELKLQEHTAFFVQAKQNGIRVAFTNRFSVQHWPFRPAKYQSFRLRDIDYFGIFLRKMNIQKWVKTINGSEAQIREID